MAFNALIKNFGIFAAHATAKSGILFLGLGGVDPHPTTNNNQPIPIVVAEEDRLTTATKRALLAHNEAWSEFCKIDTYRSIEGFYLNTKSKLVLDQRKKVRITEMYKIGDKVAVNDRMQNGYVYLISETIGSNFEYGFEPYFSPVTMLAMGIFEGKYCNDCQKELPAEWFREAHICKTPNPKINYFGIKSRQPLGVWQDKGWIIGPDPRGWFQWYCRYYLGRRLPEIDQIQIKRWRAFRRHQAQVRAHCKPGDLRCRPRQRQALLQWSYDPFI